MTKQLTVDEVNQRISLTNIKLIGQYKNSRTKTEFECYCGNRFFALPEGIFSGHTRSCGCYKIFRLSTMNFKDKTGQKFGKLLVLELLVSAPGQSKKYLCICDCGNKCVVSGYCLANGDTKSCGCLHSEIARKTIQKLHLKQKGKNNPNYNPNLSEEDRQLNKNGSRDGVWRISVFNRDGWICQVCQQCHDELNAHHMDGHHWCEERRLDVTNGITLCKDCHDDFHYMYGRKWNTLEEFEEYISKY